MNNLQNTVTLTPLVSPLVSVWIHLCLAKSKRGENQKEKTSVTAWSTPSVERSVYAAAIKDAARETRLTVQEIDAVRQEHPTHWGRMLLKRELRLEHYRNHGSVPRGITPGWPLGRNVDQIGMKLHRKQRSVAKSPKKLVQWLAVCLANTSAF